MVCEGERVHRLPVRSGYGDGIHGDRSGRGLFLCEEAPQFEGVVPLLLTVSVCEGVRVCVSV